MCVVSMIGDHYHDKWNKPDYQDWFGRIDTITKEEFNSLKKEVEEMKELLKKAIKYDEINNQPHCEIEEKIATLKKVAELLGVSLKDII